MDSVSTTHNDLPTNNEAARARKLIGSLERQNVLSKSGLSWLTIATDPWHDTDVTGVCGLPDPHIGKSVISSIPVEITIAKPSFLAAGNWNFRIHTNPINGTVNMFKATQNGITFTDTSAVVGVLHPISFTYGTGSSDFASMPGYDGNIGLASYGLRPPDSVFQCPFRVIGMGIEVINTSAALDVQGLVTMSRMNPLHSEPIMMVFSTGGVGSLVSARAIRKPPANLSQQLNEQRCVQLHAKEGAYVVVPVCPDEHAICDIASLVQIDSDIGLTGAIGQTDSYHQVLTTIAGTAASPGTFPFYNHQERVCISFTGMKDTNTLTVRARWIIEQFPGPQEPTLLALSRPSAVYDPLALELYTKVMQVLPPGCSYNENPKGEWWKRVLGGIGKVAGPLASMLPIPGAGLVGNLITSGAGMLSDSADEDKAKRKAKNLANPAKAKNSKGELKVKSIQR